MIRNIRAVFESIRKAGLKRTIEKCHFGVPKVEFFGRTITPQAIAPQDHKIQKFLANVKFPKSNEQVQKIHRLRHLLSQLHSEAIRTSAWFYELPKADKQIKATEEMLDNDKSDQRRTIGSMRIGSQTTNYKTPIRPNDG